MPKFQRSKANKVDRAEHKLNESPLEARSRKQANFQDVEAKLPKRYDRSDLSFIDKSTSLLGPNNPFGKKADPKENIVWLLDNTAYKPIKQGNSTPGPWEAEFVACFFRHGRKDLNKLISVVADQIGLDGKVGEDLEAKKRIQERVTPFVMAIAPARTVEIQIPCPTPSSVTQRRLLGPSDSNGIISQIVQTGGFDDADGNTIETESADNLFPSLKNQMHFAGPEGWLVISDIDDTIKVTKTSTPTGILRTTFADVPKTTEGMPEFYKVLHDTFKNPAWFYLSASPYNLYPFLKQFCSENYPLGTLILRDSSWMFLGGLLQSLTEGVQQYKTDRLEKIHSWLPQRKVICIGDSTQSDPESYAEMYAKYPDWIKAIYIRKVTDVPHMEEKNKNQRFMDAFKDVPDHVWRVFTNPPELADHLKHVSGQAHKGVMGGLLGM